MINISICDDNAIHLEDLRIKVDRLCTFEKDISCFSDAQVLIENIKSNKTNIVIIDIKLQEKNGIEVAETIHSIDKNIIIIFVSGYKDYFEDVYSVEHIYFLTKPVNEDKLSKALNKAYNKYLENHISNVHIRLKSGIIILDLKKIFCFESQGRNVVAFSEDENIVIPMVKLNYIMENYIPKSYQNRFLRCHQSYIVNLEKFTKYAKSKILIEGFGEVPVSRKYITQVNDKLAMFLGGYL